GESYFRKVEREVLKVIIKQNDLVIATGGGSILNDENYQLASKNSVIILLQANPEVIFNRLKEDRERPLLSEKNKLDRIKNLMEQRKDKYSRFEYSVDTSNLTVAQVVDEIIKIYRREYDEDNVSEI
ncbi:MAG: shikimate kinase, partial [Atribacterota bacterium]